MRGLALTDLLVTVLIGALLLTSPATFAYYRFGALALIVVSLLVFGLARRRSRAYWLLIGFSLVTLPLALLMLPPHFGTLDLFLIIWTLGLLPLSTAALVGCPRLSIRLPRLLLIALVAAGCVVSLRSIRTFPNFSATDEAMIVNYVDTFQHTATVGATFIPYPAAIVTGNLYVAAAALWLTLIPADPFALREFSALGGFLLIAVVFATTRALRDSLTGWLAAALLATNLLWLAVSHVGRQEIWLTLFVWTAVWLSLEARKRSSYRLALLSGLIVALSADVHPLGVYACLALGAYWLTRPISRRLLFAFVLGGLIGTAYYFTVHVLPDPGYFLSGLRDELVSYGAEGSTPLSALLARYASYLQSNPFELALLFALALWSLRQREARQLSLFVAALILLYALTVADPNLYYPMVWMPGIVILAALGLQTISPNARVPLLVAFLAAFVLNVALVERHVSADWNERALSAIQQVAARLPSEGRGMSESFLYLADRDPRFISFTFVDIWARHAGLDRWELVESLNPDWIVTIRNESAFTPPFDVLSVEMPHMHLQFSDVSLAQRYHLAQSISTSVGLFEIWKRS